MISALIRGFNSPANATAEPYEGGRLLSPLMSGQEFYPEWDIDRAYDDGLQKSAMVDRCTYGLAQKAASVPLRVWERSGTSTKGKPVGDHELDVVLNNPSRDPVMGSRDELVTRTFLHYSLAGTALTGIRKGVDVRAGKGRTRAVGLEAEDPRLVFPVASDALRVAQWNYRSGTGQTKAWERDALAAWRRHDPRNSVWGRSVLQSLAVTVDTLVESQRTQLLRTRADGRPGMILMSEHLPDRKAAEEAERGINARMKTHRGGIMYLGAEEKLVSGGMSESDLGILASMAFDRDMIAVAYGYLPAGFSNDAATYSNAGIFVLHEWGLVAETLARWTNVLTSFLFTREEQRKFYIAADYSSVQALQAVNVEKLKTLATTAFKGLSTNDLVRTLDLPIPASPFGDAILVPGKLRDLADGMGVSDEQV